ncbi:MAG: biotin/lipoyl-binding protein [Acetobacteraceae bacterium]
MDEQVGRPTLPPEKPLVTPRARDAKPRGRGRLLVTLGVLVLVLGGAYLLYTHLAGSKPAAGGSGRAGSQQAGPPQPVGAATIDTGDIKIVLSQLGTVTPLATVTVKTQINGQLTQVAFTEGQMVQQGDFLAQIDPRPFQVALEQAEGTLAHDQAVLKNSLLDLARFRTLASQDSIARQQLDTQASTVLQNQGTIKTDQALVDTSRLNLVYCHIVSP